MKKSLTLGLTCVLTTSLFLAACGKKQDTPTATSSSSTAETTQSSSKTVESTEPDIASTGSVDFSSLNKELKEHLDAATLDVVYESDQAEVTNQEDLEISLNGYELIEFSDFHNDHAIPFQDNTDRGGMLVSQFSLKNNGDKSVYFTPSFDFTFTGATKNYAHSKSILPETQPMINSIITKQKNEIKAGEEITGYTAVALDEVALETVLDLGMVTLTIPTAYSEPDNFSQDVRIGEEQKINLALTAKGSEKVASDASFYQDKITRDNMGEKTLIKAKDSLNQTETLDDVDVTLEGYQFADFEPNADTASRFTNYENGMVILTIKYLLKCNNEAGVDLTSSSSTLLVNNGQQKVLSEGMLLTREIDTLEKGQETEFLQVYVLDKEQYDLIWKEKDFGVELRLRDAERQDLGKGKSIAFDLPN